MNRDVYNLTKTLTHAKQMGLLVMRAERTFKEGVAAYSRNESAKAKELFSRTMNDLKWQILEKRNSYRGVIRSASSVMPVEDGGAAQIWTIMSSKRGDMEWNAAVSAVILVITFVPTPVSMS